MRKASIMAVLLVLGSAFLVSAGSDAMVAQTVGLRSGPTSSTTAEVALRRGGAVRTRHAAVRHRGVRVRTRHVAVRTRHVAARNRGAVQARHVAVKARSVAARRTHVAVGKRRAVSAGPSVIVRPVRPLVRQPYYGTVFDGVILGSVIAAATVPKAPSFDVCWYWANSSKTRGYWDYCQ
jgi:hypothetical protein